MGLLLRSGWGWGWGAVIVVIVAVALTLCCRCHCCANIASVCPCVVVEWVRGEGEGHRHCCCCCCHCVNIMLPCPHIIIKWVRGEGEGHCCCCCLLLLPLHCYCLHHCCHCRCVDVVICVTMPSCHCKVGEVRARGCHRGCHWVNMPSGDRYGFCHRSQSVTCIHTQAGKSILSAWVTCTHAIPYFHAFAMQSPIASTCSFERK